MKNLGISHISEWRSVNSIPSGNTEGEKQIHENYGAVGCYQFARVEDIDDIGEDLIHPKIGYIGKSTDIVNRTYSARMPKGNHGVARIINQNSWDRNDVYVRWLFCKDHTELENYLHDEMVEKYGYTFEWREASEGTDGKLSRAKEALNGLTSDEILDVVSHAKEKYLEVYLEEGKKKLEEV